MSYFVVAGTPLPIREPAKLFGPRIGLEEVTHLPIGRALVGRKAGAAAYLALSDSASHRILGLVPRAESCVDEFRAGLEALGRLVPRVSLVVHLARGELETESPEIHGPVHLSIQELVDAFPRLELETKYVAETGVPWW